MFARNISTLARIVLMFARIVSTLARIVLTFARIVFTLARIVRELPRLVPGLRPADGACCWYQLRQSAVSYQSYRSYQSYGYGRAVLITRSVVTKL